MIVFDLDGTLRITKNDEKFTPYAKGTDPSDPANWLDWQEFANANGQPNGRFVRLYTDVCSTSATVYVVTSSQFGSLDWLNRYRLPTPYSIVERNSADWSSGLAYKKPFIDRRRNQITLWVDDHPATCDYVESFDIPTLRVT